MNSLVWVFTVVLMVIGATVGSVRRVNEGNEALVERLGRYQRKLTPGLNFWVLPIIDEVVVEASTREQILDIEPSDVITKDNVTLEVNAVVFWRIMELQLAHYQIEDVRDAIKNLVITTLRSEIGQMDLQDTYASREKINRALLESLDEATDPWGVKVTRVEIQDIKIPNEKLQQAIEDERAAQSRKKAAISEAEGKREAAIAEAQGGYRAAIQGAEAIAESLKLISQATGGKVSNDEILRYLVARSYVDANLELGKSNNSKIVFMNPRDLTQSLTELVRPELGFTPPQANQNSGNSASTGNSAGNGSGGKE